MYVGAASDCSIDNEFETNSVAVLGTKRPTVRSGQLELPGRRDQSKKVSDPLLGFVARQSIHEIDVPHP
jgi:hypothetical protein